MPVFASWQKRFLDHFAACPSLKKVRVQKIFFLSQVNCSRAKCKYSMQELRKACLELHLLEKSGGEGSFGLACCLDKVAGVEKRGLTREGNVGIGGRATVGIGAELVISWVICCI